MKWHFPVVLGVVLVLAATIAVPAGGKQPVVQGARLDFRLPDVNGEPVSSRDPRFAGKVLLIELWATWCTPCISEIPTLVELQARYGDSGLVIVAIAFESEDRQDRRRAGLREFVDKQGIYYLVLDGGKPENFETALPSVKHVRGFPVEILVDRMGVVTTARNGYGFKKKWANKLRREIESLLSAPAD